MKGRLIDPHPSFLSYMGYNLIWVPLLNVRAVKISAIEKVTEHCCQVSNTGQKAEVSV